MKKIFIILLCSMLAVGLSVPASWAEDTVRVISAEGDVKVVPAGEKQEVPCEAGMALAQGAKVTTGRASYAELAFNETASNVVRVEEKTEVVIKLSKADQIELVDGELFTMLEDMQPGQTFQVRTPCATCGARGTAWSTRTDSKETSIAVAQDKVFVKGLNEDGTEMKEVWVDRGFETRVKRFEKPGKLERISEARMAKMESRMKGPDKRVAPPKEEKREKAKDLVEKKPDEKPDLSRKAETLDARTQRMDKIRSRQDRMDKTDRMNKREAIIERRVERADNVMEQRQETVVERKDEERVDTGTVTRTDSTIFIKR